MDKKCIDKEKEYIDKDIKLVPLSVEYDEKVLNQQTDVSKKIDEFFSSVTSGNKEIEQLLYEVIGYSLIDNADLGRAFLFRGKGRNGKSCVLKLVRKLLCFKKDGKDIIQCSFEHLENISGSKAGSKSTVRRLAGCTCNISEDQKNVKYIDTSMLTRIISGEPISINEDKPLVTYATMLFSVNDVIDFKETGLHITDRIWVIPFKNTFTDDNNNKDIDLINELCTEDSLKIIAARAVKAIKKALENKKFTIPKIVEEETKNYFFECNNVAEFCESTPLKRFITKAGYYSEYRKWCDYNNKEAISNQEFGKKVLSLNYREERYSFNGERKTYYVNNDFDNSNSREVYDVYLNKANNTEARIENHNGQDLKKAINCIPFSEYLCKLLYDEPENINVLI